MSDRLPYDSRGGKSSTSSYYRSHRRQRGDDDNDDDDNENDDDDNVHFNSKSRRRRDRSRSRSPPESFTREGTMLSGSSSDKQHQSYSQSQYSHDTKGLSSAGPDKFEEERRARMARLRQEMKEEDMELAALDKRKGSDGGEQQHNSLLPKKQIIQVNDEELEGLDEEEQMRRLLGFSGEFGSTKGQAVKDNQSSAARGAASKNKARKYRQYMNRKNGFNRPLDKMD